MQRSGLTFNHLDESLWVVAGHRADQVFLPVLENAVKAQKLRSTLGVFEKSKFLFNLPGQLMDSINVVSLSCRYRTKLRGRENTTKQCEITRKGLSSIQLNQPNSSLDCRQIPQHRRLSISGSLIKCGVVLRGSW
jgi:hypothetical protein